MSFDPGLELLAGDVHGVVAGTLRVEHVTDERLELCQPVPGAEIDLEVGPGVLG